MGHLKASAFLAWLLVLAPLAHSSTSPQLVAEFCDWCTTTAAARQKVWSLSPPVLCDWPAGHALSPDPPEADCRSADRRVILINPQTRTVFSYELVFDSDSNSHLIEEWALPADLSAAASTVLDIHQALMAFDFSHAVEGNETATPGSPTRLDGADCPQGTALDHYLNPGMRGWMSREVHRNWAQALSAFSQHEPRVSRSAGIGASVGPVGLTVGWGGSAGAPINEVFRAGFVFAESEVSTGPPFRDMLTFDVHEFFQIGSSISMNIEFNEGLSRVAGQPVNFLFSGQVAIDNACVMQKLEEHDRTRPDIEFRVGGPGGPPFEFPSDDDLSEGDCSKLLCAQTCIDGVCSSCQFKVTVVVACIREDSSGISMDVSDPST